MSWLSDAWHGIENVAQDVGNWAAANESWLLPVGIGVGALATGGLLGAFGPALFGAEAAGGALAGEGAALGAGEATIGASEAAFEGGAALTAEEAAAEAGAAGASEFIPGAVDITVSPFVEGAAGIESGIGAGGADVAALEGGGFGTDVLASGGPLDTILGGGSVGAGGQTAEDVAIASMAQPSIDPSFVAADIGEQGASGADAAPTFAERFTGDAASIARGDQPLGEALRAPPSAFGEGSVDVAGGGPAASTTDVGLGSYTGPGGSAGAAGDPAAAAGGTTGGGGIGSTLGGLGKGLEGALGSPLVKYGLPLAMIGGMALRGPGQLPPQTRAATDLANQQASFGASEIAQAQAGQIDPAYQAQIDTDTQNQKNQLYQLYASRGIDPRSSTDFVQASAQIDQQATAARAKIIQQMITNGLNFEGAASSTLMSAASQQVQLDSNFNSALTSAMSSFGMMAALSGGGRSTNVNITAPAGSTATRTAGDAGATAVA